MVLVRIPNIGRVHSRAGNVAPGKNWMALSRRIQQRGGGIIFSQDETAENDTVAERITSPGTLLAFTARTDRGICMENTDRSTEGEPSLRLRSARLASGYTTAQSAIDELGMPGPTYRALENGRRALTEKHSYNAAKLFGCSVAFLITGSVQNEKDESAAKILRVLQRARSEPPDLSLVAPRLMRARHDAGFRSALAAAKHFGWKRASYGAHEGRRAVPSLDTTIDYSLKLGLDAEELVFGPGREVREELVHSSNRVAKRSAHLPEEWHPTSRRISGGYELDLLVLETGEMEIREAHETMVLPISFVQPFLTQGPIFAVARQKSGRAWNEILLFARNSNDNTMVLDRRYGIRSVRAHESVERHFPGIEPKTPGELVFLGSLIGTIGNA